NVAFQNPVILSAEDTLIMVHVRDCGDNRVEYTFYETAGEDSSASSSARRYAAKLEIDRNLSMCTVDGRKAFSIQSFQERSAVIDPEGFYRTLRENGNQYGPNFQNVSSIWLASNESLGKITVVRPARQMEPDIVHPTLLDSITQVLAPFVREKGKPFVLKSIGKVEIMCVDFPSVLWAHATLQATADGVDLAGNIRVFDQSGKTYLKCSSVVMTLLANTEAAHEERPTTLAIASNFTAEPIEDSLKFWCDYFNFPVRLEFAPYNQLFQQLLDSDSAFHKNPDGINIILLGLEEWSKAKRPELALEEGKAEQCFGNYKRYFLPNGLEIVHLNKYETDYLYKEIFEDESYLKNGIRLEDGDTVVDIGANIGLFSLFVMSRCRNPRILAFEPAPVVY